MISNLFIIDTSPRGLACAIRAAQSGLKFAAAGLVAAMALAIVLSTSAAAQTPPKKPDAAWLAALTKATCIAMLIEPTKAEAIGKGRGYEVDNVGNLSFDGSEAGVRISILLVPLRNPAGPLTFRQCFIKLKDDKVDSANLRRELASAFPGTTFREVSTLPGLKGWSSNAVASGDKELVFHVLAEAEGQHAGTIDGLQINRVK